MWKIQLISSSTPSGVCGDASNTVIALTGNSLDVEDVRVRTLERMRRIFELVPAGTPFVFFIAKSWPQDAVLWLQQRGDKLGLKSDRRVGLTSATGLSAVLQAIATFSRPTIQPFHHHLFGDT